ncbi:type 2 lantipeptide synthetase LanM family protein [Spirulina subsalsa FACHB-351]|uniref:Type 2 lantipeptide synthetase LanM family protein n=1 Tax=Spirulina subsalsa FACHB-351 TaxID=234711 RepID=A0ABT3L8P3_9CYAN|nr:type 2 lanthipeptide synthetase LanM family protein [Spirulina subsalsa]MCW6037886.1 type 2 lantipeptide synthetase LanM family protein [Spirulina subsalsa FACHB-351]
MAETERRRGVQVNSLGWYQALRLEERLASGQPGAVESCCENHHLKRWQQQSPFQQGEYWQQKLASEGISEALWCAVVGESPDSLAQRLTPPQWLEQLQAAFHRSDWDNIQIASGADLADERLAVGLLHWVRPLLSDAIARLETQLPPSPPSWGVDSLKRLLLGNLPEQLLNFISQTLTLELNVARLKDQLSGNTAKERFLDFIEQLKQPHDAIALFAEYPVLTRQLVLHLEQWVNSNTELIQRLVDDWPLICSHFTEHPPRQLVKIQQGAGDRHCGGCSVAILDFSHFKLVYKPRSLAIDQQFQKLLEWFNPHLQIPFPQVKILDRGQYGWMEYITPASCETPVQIDHFYQRIGHYLALLYTLEATDFHLENLIAAGENPVLIDLETLFRPERIDPNSPESCLIANQKIAQSVMSVGLLPQRIALKEKSPGFDASGLGAVGGETLPTQSAQLSQIGTDQMRVTRQPDILPSAHNQPQLQEKPVQVWQYQASILQGFTTFYNLCLNHRSQLLNHWLPKFANCEIRVVLRDTRLYGLLLKESYHPDLLHNALDRDRFFDHLWVDVPHRPSLTQIINLEKQALWRGDIPFFTTRPNSLHLVSEGQEIANFFQQSGLERVKQKINRLSEEDLQQQQGFIQASLNSLILQQAEQYKDSKNLHYLQFTPLKIATNSAHISPLPQRLINTAQHIASHLESLGIIEENKAAWLGLGTVGEGHWTLKPLAWDLFEGLSGITLFYAYLGAVSADAAHTRLAQKCLNTIILQTHFDQPFIQSIGGFNGWGGLIYTLSHLGHLWQQPDLWQQALNWSEKLPALILKDESFDIVSGGAGCILGLISLYRCILEPNLKKIAQDCGEHLLAKALTMPQGIGWLTLPPRQPLSGFSHGVAGISFALVKLAEFTGEIRYQAAALEAWKYERSLYRTTQKNWCNAPNEPLGFSVGWSYGATGIGLARLGGINGLDSDEIQAEIKVAIETNLLALEQGLNGKNYQENHSLCNGIFGQLELLQSAILWQKRNHCLSPDLEKTYTNYLNLTLESLEQMGCRCGVPGGVDVLGLMTGLAGIGYGALRLAEPEKVPNVLLLEPPKNY